MDYFPFGLIKISGESMVPTYKSGQFVLVSPIPYFFAKPKVGDVVVVKIYNRRIIKRIEKIAAQNYFIVGDNEKASTDSRTFGCVTTTMILAKVY